MSLRSRVRQVGYLVVVDFVDDASGEAFEAELWPDGAEALARALVAGAACGRVWAANGMAQLEEMTDGR